MCSAAMLLKPTALLQGVGITNPVADAGGQECMELTGVLTLGDAVAKPQRALAPTAMGLHQAKSL